jgi:tryptophanyl-tRNA synthetase
VPTDEGKGEKVPEEGGVAVLLSLVELFQGLEKRKKYEEDYKGSGIKYADLKKELSTAISEELKPIQERRKIFEEDPERVDKILEEGAKKAREIASTRLYEVKKAMGII